jgi:hypothetical protein
VAPAWLALCGSESRSADLGSLQKPFVINRDPATNRPVSQIACGKLIELQFAQVDTGVQCFVQPIGHDSRLPSAAHTNELMSLRPIFWPLNFAGFSPELDQEFPVRAALDLEKSSLVLCMFNLSGESREITFDLKPLRHTFTQTRTSTLLPGGNWDEFKELDIRVDGIFHVAVPKDSIVLVILEDWVRDYPPVRRSNPTRSGSNRRPGQIN